MSTLAAPTFSHIKAQAKALQEKSPRARAIGIRCAGRWTGPDQWQDGERTYSIHHCDSPLAMLAALRHPCDERTTKVLITNYEGELSEDIRVRLAKRRLHALDLWQIVKTLFQARLVDPHIQRHDWIASVLVESVPSDGYPAAPAGFLDAETVWDVLLSRRLGLAGHDVDLASLLRWSIEPGAIERFRDADPVFRQAAVEWLTQRAGPATAIVLGGLPSWRKLDALALGLAASVVHHPAAIGRLEKAAGKIEGRYFSGQTPAVEVMQRWAFAAVEVVRRIRHTDQRLYREALHRGDDLLREAGADEFAYLSDTSPSGFDQRLALFGRRLKEVVAQGDWSRREDLLAERESIRRHDFAHAAAPRIERLDMALRLVGWMESASEAEPTNRRSLGAAGAEHLHEDSFADWARTALHAGDEVRELSESYTQLSAAAAARRERQAKTFAELLVDWSVVDSSPTDFVPVEKLLDEIVAPLAAERPVLLMVIDGMSAAVAHELTADLTKRGWIALAEPGRLQNRPGIAMIPSKTEYSRASLLCGARRRGAAAEEQAGFTQHAGLLAACHPGVPPILFHKVALQGDQDAGLSKEVRDAVQAANRRIVGVVLNAVDDNLKGGRLELQWSHDRMHVLPALLYEAESAGRVVVLTSDHGHILEFATEFRSDQGAEGGERWRSAHGEPAADEFLMRGPRAAATGSPLIAPWSERVRYTAGKQNGYHGGLNPQEVVTPIVVLSKLDKPPRRWSEQPLDAPAWWDAPSIVASAALPAPVLKVERATPSGMLFNPDVVEEPAGVASSSATPEVNAFQAGDAPARDAAPNATAPWIVRLLASPVFAQQKKLAGRGVPPDETLTRLLTALDDRGGKLTNAALARATSLPDVRLPGLLAKVQRIFNIDGYAVVNRDDASQTVELNRDLLLKQFDLVDE